MAKRLSEEQRLFWRIYGLEHELEVDGHNDGYSCTKCWRLEDEGWRLGRAGWTKKS